MKNIIISPENTSVTNNGIFEGWGTSLCWWANRVGFSKKLIEDSARLFFSEEGLGLNIMRYNIGGGDDPTHNHITRTDSEMPGWWKYDETNKEFIFNSDTDHNQLEVLKAAYKAAGNDAFVEAFSNSPPFYMTQSGCSSGSINAVSDNLKKSCIKDFAAYLGDVCAFIEKNYNIKIKSLAPMNEPVTDFWKAYSEKQEGCFVSPGEMQSRVIKETAEALKKRGLHNTIVTASDETNTTSQYFAIKMLYEDALSEVSRISTHTYGKATPQIGNLARELNKNLWMDETDWSGSIGENSGEMGPALWLAEKIIEDINTLSPSAWVIWQIIAAYISKNPDKKGRLDMPIIPDLTQGFWGTAFADIDNENIFLTQKYYAFGQFSRYIRAGMNIIHTNDRGSLAAYDKNTSKIVIIVLNDKTTTQHTSFNFSGFSKEYSSARTFRTSGSINDGEHWTEFPAIQFKNGVFETKLIPHSITTFIIE